MDSHIGQTWLILMTYHHQSVRIYFVISGYYYYRTFSNDFKEGEGIFFWEGEREDLPQRH